jgi:hypothetical protein
MLWTGPPRIGNYSGDREAQTKITTFGTIGFWKRWAARNNIETVKRYEQCKVSFSDDNTLNMTQMVKADEDEGDGDGGESDGGGEEESTVPNYTYYFDSLADLKEATLVEEQGLYNSEENSIHSVVISYNRQ